MASNGRFGVYKDDGKGPIWRVSFSDLAEAERNGQKFANDEQVEFFIYCFRTFVEIARIYPLRRAQATKPIESFNQPPMAE